MAILDMRAYRYSKTKAGIFRRKGSGITSCSHGFALDISREKSPSEELLKAVLKADPEFKNCAKRQSRVGTKN